MAATVVKTKHFLVSLVLETIRPVSPERRDPRVYSFRGMRQAKRDRRFMSAFTLIKKRETPKTQMSGGDRVDEPGEDRPCWVPHPRTGIYFPSGHERVVDDIPEGAASFSQAFWLRSVEGVDRTDPDPDDPTRRGFSSSELIVRIPGAEAEAVPQDLEV